MLGHNKQARPEADVTYRTQLWREARNVALPRDPDAPMIEITTPDVETASTLINHSCVENSFNQTNIPMDGETTRIINEITKTVKNPQNQAAKLLGDSFIPELKSQQPSKSRLQQYWGVLAVLPSVSTVVNSVTKITQIFAA